MSAGVSDKDLTCQSLPLFRGQLTGDRSQVVEVYGPDDPHHIRLRDSPSSASGPGLGPGGSICRRLSKADLCASLEEAEWAAMSPSLRKLVALLRADEGAL
jgi:hypothetical protein